MSTNPAATAAFRAARDHLLSIRTDYPAARDTFAWPELEQFNWALDWFDVLAAENPDGKALWIVEEDGSEQILSFGDLRDRSNRLATWLRGQGVARGDKVIVMLGNQVELWETALACIKLGAVMIPSTTLLGTPDLTDRVSRGEARHVITNGRDAAKFDDVPGDYRKIAVAGAPGFETFPDTTSGPADFAPDGVTNASDPLLLYFTSGTTAKPKLVEHTHVSYPVGCLSTMYWIGVQPGDVHLNISSPGWAKHAWSNLFTPWTAGACVMIYNYARFDAAALLAVMKRAEVDTFCAPPTVWRMLIQADLSAWKLPLRECVGAGEPLNPEVIEQVEKAWGITVRDGFGQTETTALVGNPPGQPIKAGSMGRALPGYTIAMVDPVSGEEGDDGEICIDLSKPHLGLMVGYKGDPERNADVTRGGYYHTGDVGTRDADGYITYVGRADDVFKASDYRISPFELESVLIEHEAVAEAAVVPSPDPLRLAVPKAYVVLAAGHEPNRETALSILRHCRTELAPYKRIRRIEFTDLPKTISGKIRRVELRQSEDERHSAKMTGAGDYAPRGEAEFWEEDLPELRSE
ncbi:AMP-binding protein [Sporichthya brevicatena]|uniref:AMP-binding protein n=1 Tax=Sporichthya brevicatena TaxID=171442 RepID=A0ABP3SGH8_9ACTN